MTKPKAKAAELHQVQLIMGERGSSRVLTDVTARLVVDAAFPNKLPDGVDFHAVTKTNWNPPYTPLFGGIRITAHVKPSRHGFFKAHSLQVCIKADGKIDLDAIRDKANTLHGMWRVIQDEQDKRSEATRKITAHRDSLAAECSLNTSYQFGECTELSMIHGSTSYRLVFRDLTEAQVRLVAAAYHASKPPKSETVEMPPPDPADLLGIPVSE